MIHNLIRSTVVAVVLSVAAHACHTTSAPPTTPVHSVVATCAGVDLTLSGYPFGSTLIVGVGGQPPYGKGQDQPVDINGHYFLPAESLAGAFGWTLNIGKPDGQTITDKGVATCDVPPLAACPPQTS